MYTKYLSCVLAYLFWLLPNTTISQVQRIDIDFYGHPLTFSYEYTLFEPPELDAVFRQCIDYSVADHCLGYFYEKIQLHDYQSLLKQLQEYKEKFALDDVGYFLLLSKVVDQALGNHNKNRKNLYKWFLLNQANFNAFVGYQGGKLLAFAKFDREYAQGLRRQSLDGNYHYEVSFKRKNSLPYGCCIEYTQGNGYNVITRNMYQVPKLNANIIAKKFHFYHASKSYSVNVSINKSLVDYFKDIPDLPLQQGLFGYGISNSTAASLVAQFQPIIGKKTQLEALNILLAFVQQLPYQRDHHLWGYEKANFPEETLFNYYSDCEDRVILLSYLINKLLNIETVLLFYPNDKHANLGLYLPDSKNTMDKVYGNGKRYVVCETTSQGFNVGSQPNQFKNAATQVIKLF